MLLETALLHRAGVAAPRLPKSWLSPHRPQGQAEGEDTHRQRGQLRRSKGGRRAREESWGRGSTSLRGEPRTGGASRRRPLGAQWSWAVSLRARPPGWDGTRLPESREPVWAAVGGPGLWVIGLGSDSELQVGCAEVAPPASVCLSNTGGKDPPDALTDTDGPSPAPREGASRGRAGPVKGVRTASADQRAGAGEGHGLGPPTGSMLPAWQPSGVVTTTDLATWTGTGTERPSGAGFLTQAPGIVPPPRGAQRCVQHGARPWHLAGGPVRSWLPWAPHCPPQAQSSHWGRGSLSSGMAEGQAPGGFRDMGRPRASEDPSSVPASHVVSARTEKQRFLPMGLWGGPQHSGAHPCRQAGPTPGRGVAGWFWVLVAVSPMALWSPRPPMPCLPCPGPAHPTEPGAKQGTRGSPASVDSEPPRGREPSQVPWLQQGGAQAGRPCPQGSRAWSEDTQIHGKCREARQVLRKHLSACVRNSARRGVLTCTQRSGLLGTTWAVHHSGLPTCCPPGLLLT